MTNALRKNTSATKQHKTATPQTQQARPDQVKNNAGGFVFTVSDQSRLERFLILGTDGGTYYVNEKDHTKDNITFLKKMIADNERNVVDTLVDVSVKGRAYKQSPALFALAVVMTDGQDKAYAREAFNKVVRTSTHLFEITQYLDDLGGWGRSKRTTVSKWYESKDDDSLAYQLVKYRQRDGWTHKDVLRLSHAKPSTANAHFALGKGVDHDAAEILEGYAVMQAVKSAKDVVSVLETYKNLPWETIPTEFHKDAKVWKTLFYNGQLNGQALVRNITRISRLSGFDDLNFAVDYAAKLTDVEMLRKTRLHPVNLLNAAVTYDEGQFPRGNTGGYFNSYSRTKDWAVSGIIKDALNEAFHLSFQTIVPANKRNLVAVDVSGSMSSAAMGIDLSCAQVSGALAMTIARTEPASMIRGFTTGGNRGRWGMGSSELTDLGISAKTSLSSAMNAVRKNNFGGTDCSQPMLWALENKVEIDTFSVITDNETWAGTIQPMQALKKYRDQMGIDAKLAVFGVAGSPFTIADPQDRGSMDFVGFDSNAPAVFTDFSAGRI